MPPQNRSEGDLDRDVRLGVIEQQTERLEGRVDTLVGDHAKLSATVELVQERLASIDKRLEAVPARVAETEVRIATQLSRQDESLEHLEKDVSETKDAAQAARSIAGQALVAAKKEWPTIAKAAVTVLGGILAGVVVYLITHLIG